MTGVVVTLGARGAVLAAGGPPLVVPAIPAPLVDPCGAGDRFCATATAALGAGTRLLDGVTAAVASASAFVASGGAFASGTPPPPRPGSAAIGLEAALRAAAHARGRRGRVVAAGGCFDLLHAGHVGLLQMARDLGDCLVVLLNSDRSVRELKGPGRPVVPEEDRAAVLAALGCVDAVLVFDERTPVEALRGLRPDLFCKGADYADQELPEAAVMAEWGGEVVFLPRLEGRSTSALVHAARGHEDCR